MQRTGDILIRWDRDLIQRKIKKRWDNQEETVSKKYRRLYNGVNPTDDVAKNGFDYYNFKPYNGVHPTDDVAEKWYQFMMTTIEKKI